MSTINVEKINEVFIRCYADPGIEQELSQFFTYEYPGARFTPQYRARLWDGKVRLYDVFRKTLYNGLLGYVEEFAKNNEYELNYITPVESKSIVSIEEIKSYADWLKPMGHGKPIEIRDYQLEAVHKAVTDERVLLLSPTASGKSFIIYTTLRWHLEQGRKCIIVVPTTSLVEQLYSDFED
jgi:replicative superfamily II helicase